MRQKILIVVLGLAVLALVIQLLTGHAVLCIAIVDGSSMEPTLNAGDVVLARWGRGKIGDIVVARDLRGDVMVKRISYTQSVSRPPRVELSSDYAADAVLYVTTPRLIKGVVFCRVHRGQIEGMGYE